MGLTTGRFGRVLSAQEKSDLHVSDAEMTLRVDLKKTSYVGR